MVSYMRSESAPKAPKEHGGTPAEAAARGTTERGATDTASRPTASSRGRRTTERLMSRDASDAFDDAGVALDTTSTSRHGAATRDESAAECRPRARFGRVLLRPWRGLVRVRDCRGAGGAGEPRQRLLPRQPCIATKPSQPWLRSSSRRELVYHCLLPRWLLPAKRSAPPAARDVLAFAVVAFFSFFF
jgi:hypothetical protein